MQESLPATNYQQNSSGRMGSERAGKDARGEPHQWTARAQHLLSDAIESCRRPEDCTIQDPLPSGAKVKRD